MGISVTGPEVTINTRTVKAFFTEQIIFNVQIIDITDTQINNYDETSGLETVIDLEAAAGDKTALFHAGAVVWLNVESGAGYVGRGVVETSTFGAPHAGVTTITFTELFGIGTTAVIDVDDFFYIISQKVGRFWRLIAGGTSTSLTSDLYMHPQETGLIEVDVGPVVSDYMRANDLTHLFFTINTREAPTSGGVHGTDYIAVRGEVGAGGTHDNAAFLYTVHATGAGGGGNLGGMPLSRFWTYGALDDETVFEDMAFWWEGWTTTVSYLFDEDTGADPVYIQQNDVFDDQAPAAKSTLETIDTVASDPQVFEKELAIPTADAIFIETYFSDTVTRADASKKVVFKIVRTANLPRNPMMLKWRNSLGGFSHWLFGGCNNFEDITYESIGKGTYDKFQGSAFYDSPMGARTEISRKKTVQKITMQANFLTFGQLTAIREILTTDELFAYATVKSGAELVRLTVDPGAFTIGYSGKDTKTTEFKGQVNNIKDAQGIYSLDITVNFPPGYDYHRDQAL